MNYLNQNELKGEIHADDGVKLGDRVVNNGVITYTLYQTEKEYTNVSVSIGASISFSSSSDGLVRIGNMDLKISDKAGISKTGSYRQTELTGHIGLFRYLKLTGEVPGTVITDVLNVDSSSANSNQSFHEEDKGQGVQITAISSTILLTGNINIGWLSTG